MLGLIGDARASAVQDLRTINCIINAVREGCSYSLKPALPASDLLLILGISSV